MNNDIKQQIFDRIASYDTIIISRHKRPDGDAVGSSLGLKRVLEASFPGKRVYLANTDSAPFLAFLGSEGPLPAPEDYKDALVIVLDTGNIERCSDPRALEGREVIKIDHHICDDNYGDLAWIEEERSSVCEMVAEFCLSFGDRLTVTRAAAECLYTGIVTDSGRFRFRGTDGNTLRIAARLLDIGVDFERIYAEIGADEPETIQFEGYMLSRIKFTPSGVAYLRISRRLRHNRGISQEDAANTVSLMEHIRGSLIWIAFIEYDDGTTRVRLRSRFVEVQPLAVKYRGGGHACASGATVYTKAEEQQLLAEADALLAAFKAAKPELI